MADIINYNDLPAVKRIIQYSKARFITERLLVVLEDYYRGTGVDIKDETDLPELMTNELMICLFELKS